MKPNKEIKCPVVTSYERAGRKSKNIPGQPLIVQELNYEGSVIKKYSKSGTIPSGYFQIKNGKEVAITEEEYEAIKGEKK